MPFLMAIWGAVALVAFLAGENKEEEGPKTVVTIEDDTTPAELQAQLVAGGLDLSGISEEELEQLLDQLTKRRS